MRPILRRIFQIAVLLSLPQIAWSTPPVDPEAKRIIEEFGLREILLAEEQGIQPESLFDDLLRSVPAGSTR